MIAALSTRKLVAVCKDAGVTFLQERNCGLQQSWSWLHGGKSIEAEAVTSSKRSAAEDAIRQLRIRI